MANPKPEIWGDSSTWINAPYSYGLTSTLANTLNAAKPKVNDYQSDSSNVWDSSLYRAIQQGVMTLNEFIDDTICPCGQDPTVSPFSKLVVINEDDSFSVELSHIRTIERNEVINWFFADRVSQTSSSQGYTYRAAYSSGSTTDTFDNQQFAPKAKALDTSNINFQVCPYTYYGLKTFVLRIQVRCFAKDDTRAPSIYSTWRTLDTWKDTYSDTEDIIGLRFRLMACNQISTSTLALTYDSSGSISTGCANMLCVTNPITVENNGVDTDTQLLTLFTQGGNERCAYIFDCTQHVYNYGDYRRERVVLPCYNYFEGQTLNRYKPSSDPVAQFYYRIPYSDDTYNKILKIASLFGCYFTPTNTVTFSYSMTDNDLYLSVVGDDGIARGEYTKGSDNANNPLSGKNSIRDVDYDPTKPPTPIDPNTYSDTTNWNSVNFQNTFCKRYELTAAQVGQLATELWSAQASKPADIDYHNFAIDEYLTNNPIDTIVSLKYFPCDVETAANPAIVHLGKYQTNIAANGISHTVKIIDYPPIDVFPHFGDFRDYEPYTTLQMYIPFCGTVSIPTAEAMGKWVSVKLCIDINTGACAGFVIVSSNGSGGICVATATGTASIDIPVSGLQSANLSQAIFYATANWTQTQISNAKISSGLMSHAGGLLGNISKGLNKQGALSTSGLLGALTGGPVGALKMAENLDPYKAYLSGLETDIESSKADYQLSHIELPMRLIGSTSPVLSSVIESSCRLIIYRPVTDESALAEYADTVGFATLSSGTVSQFHGYTEGTIDVRGINATATEKSEIQRLFAGGVYL